MDIFCKDLCKHRLSLCSRLLVKTIIAMFPINAYSSRLLVKTIMAMFPINAYMQCRRTNNNNEAKQTNSHLSSAINSATRSYDEKIAVALSLK